MNKRPERPEHSLKSILEEIKERRKKRTLLSTIVLECQISWEMSTRGAYNFIHSHIEDISSWVKLSKHSDKRHYYHGKVLSEVVSERLSDYLICLGFSDKERKEIYYRFTRAVPDIKYPENSNHRLPNVCLKF